MKAASRFIPIIIVLVLLSLLCAGMAGCTKDSEEPDTGVTENTPPGTMLSIPARVANPEVVSDGAGGVLVAYGELETDGNQSIHLKRIDSFGTAVWDKELGLAYTYNQNNLTLLSDGCGGAVMHVLSAPSDAMSLEIPKIIRIDANGGILWETGLPDGARMEQMCPDGTGNVFILYSKNNTWATGYIGRIDDSGQFLWDEYDVLIRRDNCQSGTSLMEPDGSGGVFITWVELDSGSRILGQRIDAEGEFLWEGQSIIERGKELHFAPQGFNGQQMVMMPDGEGGILLNWIGRNEITVFHTDQSGEPVWTMNIDVMQSGEYPGYEHFPCIFRDLSGDIHFFWSDVTTIYTQKLDDTGALVSPGSGIVLWEDPEKARWWMDVVPNQAGGMYVVWNYMELLGSSQEKHLRLMRFDAENDMLWSDTISTSEDIYASFGDILADNDTGVFFTWTTGPIEPSSLGPNILAPKDTFIQKYTSEGEPLWGADGMQLNP